MAIPQNLGDLIGANADPDKLALIALGDPAQGNGAWDETRVTYGELDARANGVARALSRSGFKTGERIAILSANRAEYVAALLGIMRAGLIVVPVNFKFPVALSNFVIRDSGARLVFCDAPRLADAPADIPSVVFDGEGENSFASFLDMGPHEAYASATDDPAIVSRLKGVFVIRLAVGNLRTEERHVRRAWQLLTAAVKTELDARA